MTGELFVKLSSEYFGDYRPVVQHEVLLELTSWNEQLIVDLWQEMKENKQTAFKSPPDIFDIVHSAAYANKKARERTKRIDERTKKRLAIAKGYDSEAEDFSDKIVSIFKRGVG